VDGLPITGARKRYVVLNKPRGIVTTRSDERGRRTIYDHMGPMEEWLAPVGRLDRDSEGLLLLTNDSRLAAWLTDPANAVPRVYEVTVRPAMEAQAVASLLRGVQIGGGEVAVPTHVRLLSTGTGAGVVELTLVEGKNREVRRIFRALSRRVLRLRRTRFGPFELGDLPTGQWRVEPLSEEEARRLRRPYSSQ
jgi:23S rRNA pseudouridine2605 synthase